MQLSGLSASNCVVGLPLEGDHRLVNGVSEVFCLFQESSRIFIIRLVIEKKTGLRDFYFKFPAYRFREFLQDGKPDILGVVFDLKFR